MRAGGHVVWVCGQNVQPAAYNAMNALAQGLLLPAPLEDLRQPLPGGVEAGTSASSTRTARRSPP